MNKDKETNKLPVPMPKRIGPEVDVTVAEPSVVKAADYMVAITQTLVNTREQARKETEAAARRYQDAQQQINIYLSQCATTLGLNPDEYTFSDKDLGFVKKENRVVSDMEAATMLAKKGLPAPIPFTAKDKQAEEQLHV